MLKLEHEPLPGDGVTLVDTLRIILPCKSVDEEDDCRKQFGKIIIEELFRDILYCPPTSYWVREGPFVSGNGGIIPMSEHGKHFYINIYG